jgi:hypothetical protein
MGTSGTALYADDTACDVRDQFIELLARSASPEEATNAFIRSWAAQIDDAEDGPVFWLALADTQWKYGCLSQEVRIRAVEVIETESDLQRWEGVYRERRRVALAKLKEKLSSPQPNQRRPRQRKPVEIPSLKVLSPDRQALATAYQLGANPQPNAPRMQVIVEMLSSGEWGGGGVFVASCAYSDVLLEWLNSNMLQITYPPTAVLSDQQHSTFFYGRTIQLVYRTAA